MNIGSSASRLEALERQLDAEMETTEALGRVWAQAPVAGPSEMPRYNVVICGAGMSGLAIAFGLKRRGIEGVLVIDKAEEGREGPWIGCARMKTLRSPKYLAGPDFGLPSLTPRAWFEALHGADAYESLDKMSRQDWMEYLGWYRSVTEPTVANRTSLTGISHVDGWLRLDLQSGSTSRQIECHRLILATGIDGGGAPLVPDFIRALPKETWTHSAEVADDSHLRDRDVAILGSATSSFDWAVTALEKGARSVTMIGRSRNFGRTEVLAWTNFPGFLGHFPELPDLTKWRYIRLYNGFKIPPTQDQFDRAVSNPRFKMTLGQKVRSMSLKDGRIVIESDNGTVMADHLLLGTGYKIDFTIRPELKAIAPHVAFWGDRFDPPEGEASMEISAHPYLGRGFELTAKDPQTHGWLSRIHLFNCSAIASLGPISNGVTGMKYGLPRIVDAVAGGLFQETAHDFLRDLAAYREHHFDPRGHGEDSKA
ncbi:MAG TPA: NAD(P)/FAD-dependent oxidoreductase [Ensifer sp.]|nr:NAD(P)/FAD-dependent oxidoreductase [Ensifer sp.]